METQAIAGRASLDGHTGPVAFVLTVANTDGSPYTRLEAKKLSFQFVMPDYRVLHATSANVLEIKDLGQGVAMVRVAPPKDPKLQGPGAWMPGETLAVIQIDEQVTYREGGSTATKTLLTLGRALVRFHVD